VFAIQDLEKRIHKVNPNAVVMIQHQHDDTCIVWMSVGTITVSSREANRLAEHISWLKNQRSA
jgi:hypothetical protein